MTRVALGAGVTRRTTPWLRLRLERMPTDEVKAMHEGAVNLLRRHLGRPEPLRRVMARVALALGMTGLTGRAIGSGGVTVPPYPRRVVREKAHRPQAAQI